MYQNVNLKGVLLVSFAALSILLLFFTSTPPVTSRNSNYDEPRILMWTKYTTARTRLNIERAIQRYYPKAKIYETRVDNASEIKEIMETFEIDIFWLPTQINVSSLEMIRFGEDLEPTINNFLSFGGDIVSHCESEATDGFLQGAGLIEIEHIAMVPQFGELNILEPAAFLLDGIETPFNAQLTTMAYRYLSEPAITLVTDQNNNIVLGKKQIGNGKLFFTGLCFSSFETSHERLLANIISSSLNSLPLATLTATPFGTPYSYPPYPTNTPRAYGPPTDVEIATFNGSVEGQGLIYVVTIGLMLMFWIGFKLLKYNLKEYL